MKKRLTQGFFARIGVLSMLAFGLILLSGCFNQTVSNVLDKVGEVKDKLAGSGDTDWKFTPTIAAPITGKAAKNEDISLGDVAANKVKVEIPKGALDSDMDITLKNPAETPKVVGAEIDSFLGAPIEVGIDKPVRLNEPVKITFAFDKNAIASNTPAYDLQVAYFNGRKWEYVRADSVDMEKGTMTFTTYHFSLLGATKIKENAVITQQWIHSKTLDKELRYNINKKTDEISGKLIDMTLEKMGMDNKEMKTKILADVLKDDAYKKLYDAYQKGDVVDINQKLAILAAKKIAQNVPASTLQAGLKHFTDEKGIEDAASIGKAAGYAAEGQYTEAAKILADRIIDKTMVGLAGKIAVEVVDYQIQSWKNSEVEAAYKAYQHGANGIFWGYNVDKGDFDGVWDQMRGIGRQLSIEAITKENKARAEAGMPPLNEKQMDIVRDRVKESYRAQFTARAEQETVLAEKEAKLRTLVEAFDKADFFGSTGPIDKGLDFENKLDVYYHFAEKMMQDTKRPELTDLNGLLVDGKLSPDDIVQGARYYFGPDGKKLYAKFLKDRFNVSLSPALKDLAGKWAGTMVIKDVYIDEALKKAAQSGKKDPNGCDFNIDLNQLKGKSQALKMTIAATGENSGTLSFDSGDKPKTSPLNYENGVIKSSISDKGAVGSIQLTVDENDTAYTANGSLIINYAEGKVKITASITSSKAKPAKPKTPAKPAKK